MKIPLYLRIVLPLTIAACGYAMLTETTSDEAAPVPAKAVSKKAKAADKNLSTLPGLLALAPRNLFPNQGPQAMAARNAPLPALNRPKEEAAQPVPIPAPVPASAPAFPMKVSGVWVDGAQRKIVLTKGDSTVILCQGCGAGASPKIGDVLERNYRLEKIENERITFTYLPLQLEHIVDIDRAISGTGN